MNDDTIKSGFREMLDGVTLCYENGLTLPMLTLIYANIDALGWLASDSEVASSASFTNWVDRFLRPEITLDCTALELYAARCGLLHTGSPESRLYDAGRARAIVYASEGSAAGLQAFTELIRPGRCIAIDIQSIYFAYVEAVRSFEREIQNNIGLYPHWQEKLIKTFMARRKMPKNTKKEKSVEE